MNIANEINWLQFMREKVEPKIKPNILDSWKRSQEYKINPYADNLNQALKISYKKTPDGKAFFNEVVEYINNCYDPTDQDDSAWVFCDPDGYILKIRCNSNDFKTEMFNLGITERISLAENSLGTNAIALCINTQSPAICIESEHYLKVLHKYKAVASPIFNIEGIKMGYCMLIARRSYMRSSMLKAMILLLIEGVDRSFRLTRSRARHDNLKQKVEKAIFENHLKPTVFLTNKGFIRQINTSAMQLFEIDMDTRNETNLDLVANFTPSIKEIASSGLQTENLPVTVEMKSGKKITMQANRLPYYNHTGQFIGVSLQFSENALTQTKPHSTYKAKFNFSDLVGISKNFQQAKDVAMRVSDTNMNVLLIGPKGVGKEVFAHCIHNASSRMSAPFVAVNLSIISPENIEEELFGNNFNKQNLSPKEGKLNLANGGTIFLDEINFLPIEVQGKLIKLIEQNKQEYNDNKAEKLLDVRIIASTSKDLLEFVQKNLFREDLYYHLSVTSILRRPLTECRDDIPILAQSFIELFNEQMGKKVLGFKDDIMERLKTYTWPGNIQELKSAVEFAIMLNQGEPLIPWEHMPGHLRLPLLYQKKFTDNQDGDPLNIERESINKSEKALIKKAIDISNGRLNEAAKILGISRATIYRKIRKLGILI